MKNGHIWGLTSTTTWSPLFLIFSHLQECHRLFSVIGINVSVNIKARQRPKVHVHTREQIACRMENVAVTVTSPNSRAGALSHMPGWERACPRVVKSQIPTTCWGDWRGLGEGWGGCLTHGWAAGLARQVFSADKEIGRIDWCRRSGDSGRCH